MRNLRNIILYAWLILMSLGAVVYSQVSISGEQPTVVSYREEVEKWRQKRENDLKGEDSWLSLAGLFWLKDGENSFGSAAGNDIVLPDEKGVPKQAGVIIYRNGTATLRLDKSAQNVIKIDGQAPSDNFELKSDDGQKPNVLQIGDIKFNLIKREKLVGVRVKNKNSLTRLQFKGLSWFPVDEKLKIKATFVPYQQPKEVLVPNVLGSSFTMKSPGLLSFQLNGQEYKLEPVLEGKQLFIIFRDLTSKNETYSAGRFLYADLPNEGETTVILDFNKAYNPPCAFTHFATCPLPPPQNRLAVKILAGEKRYGNRTH